MSEELASIKDIRKKFNIMHSFDEYLRENGGIAKIHDDVIDMTIKELIILSSYIQFDKRVNDVELPRIIGKFKQSFKHLHLPFNDMNISIHPSIYMDHISFTVFHSKDGSTDLTPKLLTVVKVEMTEFPRSYDIMHRAHYVDIIDDVTKDIVEALIDHINNNVLSSDDIQYEY